VNFNPVDSYALSADHSRMVKASDGDKKDVPELLQFGEAVREQRKARGYSQEAFGDACGIDRSYMGGIERGQHNLALVNIMKIIAIKELLGKEFAAIRGDGG